MERRDLLDRVAGQPPALLLGLSGGLFVVLSLWAMAGESSTFDEGVHLAAGYSYLDARDFRMNPEHPPLSKILSAIPLLFQSIRWPKDKDSWRSANEAIFEYQLLYQSGNDPGRMLFWGRLPTLFWALVLLSTTYAVSREFFGPRGGLLSLVLATFSPDLLAHGHLVTTDVAVTALMLLSLVAFWKFLGTPTIPWGLAAGVLLGGALGAKYSAVLLVPILGLVAVGRLLKTRMSGRAAGSREGGPGGAPARRWLRWGVCLGLFGFAAVATIWGLYGFRYGFSKDGTYEYSIRMGESSSGLSSRAMSWASELRALPAAYLYGLAGVQEHSAGGHPAYALGRHSATGWWWYFPFAFLVKMPAAALVLLGWGIATAVRKGGGKGIPVDLLLTPVIVYGVLAVASHLNIGVRHLLPMYPLLFILAGGVDLSLAERPGAAWPRRLVLGLAGLVVAGTLASAPFFLAYFNVPSRLLFDRHEMLVDSNLDWGQDLGRLKAYLDQNGIPRVKLAYFGDASPRQVGLDHEVLPGNHSYSNYEPEWKPAREIGPGDVVAISASSLVGVGLPDPDVYRRAVRGLTPLAVVGHSILVYRIPGNGR
jgi:hypothetical protein